MVASRVVLCVTDRERHKNCGGAAWRPVWQWRHLVTGWWHGHILTLTRVWHTATHNGYTQLYIYHKKLRCYTIFVQSFLVSNSGWLWSMYNLWWKTRLPLKVVLSFIICKVRSFVLLKAADSPFNGWLRDVIVLRSLNCTIFNVSKSFVNYSVSGVAAAAPGPAPNSHYRLAAPNLFPFLSWLNPFFQDVTSNIFPWSSDIFYWIFQ